MLFDLRNNNLKYYFETLILPPVKGVIDHEICILGGHLMDAEDYASLSANSLPAIPA